MARRGGSWVWARLARLLLLLSAVSSGTAGSERSQTRRTLRGAQVGGLSSSETSSLLQPATQRAPSPEVAFSHMQAKAASAKIHLEPRHDTDSARREDGREEEEEREEREQMREEQEEMREEQEEILQEQEEIQQEQEELQQEQEELQIHQEELQKQQEEVERQLVEAGLVNASTTGNSDGSDSDEEDQKRDAAKSRRGSGSGTALHEEGDVSFLQNPASKTDATNEMSRVLPSKEETTTLSDEVHPDLLVAKDSFTSQEDVSSKQRDVHPHLAELGSKGESEAPDNAGEEGHLDSQYSCKGLPCGAGERSCKALLAGIACTCSPGFQLRKLETLDQEQLDEWKQERKVALASDAADNTASSAENASLLPTHKLARALGLGLVNSVCVRVRHPSAAGTAFPPKEEKQEGVGANGGSWATAGIGIGAGIVFAFGGAVLWHRRRKSALKGDDDDDESLISESGPSTRDEIRPLSDANMGSTSSQSRRSEGRKGTSSRSDGAQTGGAKGPSAVKSGEEEEEDLSDLEAEEEEWEPTPLPVARDSHFAVSIEEQNMLQQKANEQKKNAQPEENAPRKPALQTRMTMLEQAMRREATPI